jgi:hypothetical protein
MLELVQTWLAPFPEAYAVVFLQPGPTSERIHAHVLVGGIGGLSESILRASWVKRGHARVEQFKPSLGFHPSRGGVRYSVDQAEEIEIIGSPVLYKPRHNKGHRGRNRQTVKDVTDLG